MNRFEDEKRAGIDAMRDNAPLKAATRAWFDESARARYSYHFTWLGRPIIQYPQDIVAIQEIVWSVQPDLIIETGVAHGGSLVLSASLLALLGGDRRVIGIDIDIRPHNRRAIEEHPLARYIDLVQGSSISEPVLADVRTRAAKYRKALVILDSNHTHEHVARELELYSPFVKSGSYLLVFDTVIEDMPPDAFPDRPWGRGNNPKTAVQQFLRTNGRFEVDSTFDSKLQITVAPGGFLRCIAD